MKLHPLRSHSHPDISDFVVHFTGRSGQHSYVPADILKMQPWERLTQIMISRTIRAFSPFGSSDPVVCFTECTQPGIRALMSAKRYEPCGIAFRKDTVFAAGGGPALYIRGDEWDEVDELPPNLRARATRFWPGAEADVGEEPLSWNLERPSEWTHEREWRVLASGNPPVFRFTWEDVAFVISPDERWQPFVASFIGDLIEGPAYAPFMKIPTVVVSPDGTAIRDPSKIWLT